MSSPSCFAISRSPEPASIPNKARRTFAAGTSIPESGGTSPWRASSRARAMIAVVSIAARNEHGDISPAGSSDSGTTGERLMPPARPIGRRATRTPAPEIREVSMNIRRGNAATAFGSAIALIAIIAVFVVVLPSLVQPPGRVIGIDTGQVAPACVIEDVNGTKWNLSEHRGEVILLDFMGSYCAPCADEMKDGSMQSLYDNYSSRGFTILSVDVGGVSGTENPLVAWQFIRGIKSDGILRADGGRW